MKSGIYWGGTNMLMIEVRNYKGVSVVVYLNKNRPRTECVPTKKLVKQLTKVRFKYLGEV